MELARKFEQTAADPGFQILLGVMAEKVNSEIEGATALESKPEEMRMAVVRWNAMRRMLDEVQSAMTQAIKERDEILSLEREENEQERMHA